MCLGQFSSCCPSQESRTIRLVRGLHRLASHIRRSFAQRFYYNRRISLFLLLFHYGSGLVADLPALMVVADKLTAGVALLGRYVATGRAVNSLYKYPMLVWPHFLLLRNVLVLSLPSVLVSWLSLRSRIRVVLYLQIGARR